MPGLMIPVSTRPTGTVPIPNKDEGWIQGFNHLFGTTLNIIRKEKY